MGLSGVTCAMIAYEARWDPARVFQLGAFVPIKVEAGLLLLGLLVWSALGAIVQNGDGVAHAVHLGGLIFGVLYYEYLWGLGRQNLKEKLRLRIQW